MSAHNAEYPWLSYYGHYKFFERALREHNKVKELKSESTGVYLLKREAQPDLRVFICECYSFGMAEYQEVVEKLGKIDVIIINSTWCDYSLELKRYCRTIKVGIFKIADFMAAINKKNWWSHLNDREVEFFTNKGWI